MVTDIDAEKWPTNMIESVLHILKGGYTNVHFQVGVNQW